MQVYLLDTVNGKYLNNLEKLWIVLLDAQNKHVGYNVAAGGSGGRVGPLREPPSTASNCETA